MGEETLVVLRSLLALVGVCALAWFTLSQLARRGIGVTGRGTRVRVLERVVLAPRRQLYVVRVDGRDLLLGAADAGSITLIAELDAPRSEPVAPGANEALGGQSAQRDVAKPPARIEA